MKRLIVLSAIAMFAVSASAQTGVPSNGHGKAVSTEARETTLKGKAKGESVRDLAKANRADDSNGIRLTKEEKEARKAARKAELEARKADRVQDGNFGDLNNDGTISPDEREARKQAKRAAAEERQAGRYDEDRANKGKNEHGERVSGTARGTDLERREKGAAVSGTASSKARNAERVKVNAKPRTSVKPAGGASRGRNGKIK